MADQLSNKIMRRAFVKTVVRRIFALVALGGMIYGLVALVPGWGWLFPVRVLGAFARAGYGTSSLALMGDLLERVKGDAEWGLGVLGSTRMEYARVVALVDQVSRSLATALFAAIADAGCVLTDFAMRWG